MHMKNLVKKNAVNEPSEDEIKAVKRKIADSLSYSRLKLITTYPFIGTVAMSMNIVPVRDVRVRTMCTDGSTIFADCDFTLGLNPDKRVFVLAHEVWHACLSHMLRLQTRDPRIFNIATDKEVNYLLKCDGFTSPKDILYPTEEEVGKCAEEIYEMLVKKMKQEAKKQASEFQKDGDSGKGLKGQFDRHLYDTDRDAESENEGEGEGEGVSDRWGKVGFDDDFRPRVSKEASERMRETMVAAAQQLQKSRGTLPMHIAGLIGNLLEPEINWREELSKFVTKCMGGGRRYWLPPNRRHVYNDVYLQSRRSERIKVAAIVDTSGSTSADLGKFVSELNGLVSSFGQFEFTLVQCDAEVQSAEIYSDENPFQNADGFEVCGGGGTCLKPAFDWLEENAVDADCIVVFTDGETERFTKDMDPGTPVMWVLTADGTDSNIEFGKITRFKRDAAA